MRGIFCCFKSDDDPPWSAAWRNGTCTWSHLECIFCITLNPSFCSNRYPHIAIAISSVTHCKHRGRGYLRPRSNIKRSGWQWQCVFVLLAIVDPKSDIRHYCCCYRQQPGLIWLVIDPLCSFIQLACSKTISLCLFYSVARFLFYPLYTYVLILLLGGKRVDGNKLVVCYFTL